MEVSSGEEYYIASDNTGTPLAVFSSNGQMIKQVTHTHSGRATSTYCRYLQHLTAGKSLFMATVPLPENILVKVLNPY